MNFLTFYTVLGELLLVLDDGPILSYIVGLEEVEKSFLGIISVVAATYSVDDLGRNANARARRFVLELFDVLRFLGNSTDRTENIDGIDVVLVWKRGNLPNQRDSPKGGYLGGLVTLIFFSAANSDNVLVLLLIGVFLRVVTSDSFAFALVVLGTRGGSDVIIGLLLILARGLLWIYLLADGMTGLGLATFSRRLCYMAGDIANSLGRYCGLLVCSKRRRYCTSTTD